VPRKDIVVVGASAGGIEALRALAAGLPKDFPASVFVVQHTAAESPGVLADILSRAGALPAVNARDRERIKPGHIYVAPPDYHLMVEPGVVRITKGPKENRFRPAVDPLFRSAAQVYGPRVVGVVLTGNLDDGAVGLRVVKQLGGTAVVQDPEDALYPSMPESARRQVRVDYSLPLAEIAPLLARLAKDSAAEEGAHEVPEQIKIEVAIAKEENALEAGVERLGDPSPYACPECHGVLLQMKEAAPLRFRCHTGHAYTADSLLHEITEAVEDSLWNSIRSIEESVRLLRHMAEHLPEGNGDGDGNLAEAFRRKAQEAQSRSDLVRRAAMRHEELNTDRVADSEEP
jgi:two-component system chemotaxis response regulator CheB